MARPRTRTLLLLVVGVVAWRIVSEIAAGRSDGSPESPTDQHSISMESGTSAESLPPREPIASVPVESPPSTSSEPAASKEPAPKPDATTEVSSADAPSSWRSRVAVIGACCAIVLAVWALVTPMAWWSPLLIASAIVIAMVCVRIAPARARGASTPVSTS